MNYNENLYQILGLDKNSNKDEIKKNFRKLSKQHHPDVNDGSDEQFKKIASAYEILSDEKKKNEYDINSPHGKNYNPNANLNNFFSFNTGGFDPFAGGNPFGAGNPFADFGFSFNDIFGRREEFIEDLDVRIHANLTLKDVYLNNPIKIKFSHFVKCDLCNFSGFDPDSDSFDCDACDGKGGDGFTKCKYCNGSGKIHSGTCKKCNGTKVISKEDEITLSGTFNIDKNFVKYVRGAGHQSKYYANKVGSLNMNIDYIDDIRYTREGSNLICKLDLHYKKAIDGFDLEYTHLDDRKYMLKIPPKTKDGDSLRMPGKGLMINDNLRGDLIMRINIVIDYSLEN